MRSIALLTVAAVAAVWAVVRHLPAENEAVAETAHPQQIVGVSLDALDNGHALPVSALRAVLDTKSGDLLDPTNLEHDRAAIRTVLEGRGFLGARVEAPTVTFSGGGAYVVFAVSCGTVYHFRDITTSGLNARDAGLVTLGAWDTANPERVERVRQALAEVAGGKTVIATLHTDTAANAVDVEFSIK